MRIGQIYTKRRFANQNYAQPIIYEWEDEIANELNIPIYDYPSYYNTINKHSIHSSLISPIKNTFRFVVNGTDSDEPMNNKHIIPCIIDFFEKEDSLQEFYKKHSKNKIVFLSSPFDVQYLKDRKCPLNIGLLPYSLSSKYAITQKTVKKKYDIVLTGRQDPLLYSFFKEYVKAHPDVTYVKRGKDIENDDNKTKAYYLNGKDLIGSLDSREDFFTLQSQGRVTLYGFQGYLNGFTKGFYHITPHFLEIIACGSHVIAHYPSGEEGVDAQYYEINKFSPSVESYDQFEDAMDHALRNNVDLNMYSAYLSKHYTSTRIHNVLSLINEL